MATIDSVKLPDNSSYDLADNYSGYQTETLATPITVDGTSETTVEGALGGLNDYGDALADNLAANEESGAKNFNVYPYYETTKWENGLDFVDNGDGTVTVSGTAGATTIFYCHMRDAIYANGLKIPNGSYKFSGAINSNISANLAIRAKGSGSYEYIGSDLGAGLSFTIDGDYYSDDNAQLEIALIVDSGTVISTPITFKPMIRDARVIDPTFAPYAKTNKQLTDDKAERSDLATLNLTGSTNSTGSTINKDTYFYLNGSYCKAKTAIANGATFTLNTNFKVVTVGGELNELAYKKAVIQFDVSEFDSQLGGYVAYKNIASDIENSSYIDGVFVSALDGVYNSFTCGIRGIDPSTTYLVVKTFDSSPSNAEVTVLYH